ncbi:hypothetical protein HDU97_001405 [Phlyctochytrium planicorne]|nr:hypothetical protein HDU97_001405 [Phlyctochytrium planicorne]
MSNKVLIISITISAFLVVASLVATGFIFRYYLKKRAEEDEELPPLSVNPDIRPLPSNSANETDANYIKMRPKQSELVKDPAWLEKQKLKEHFEKAEAELLAAQASGSGSGSGSGSNGSDALETAADPKGKGKARAVEPSTSPSSGPSRLGSSESNLASTAVETAPLPILVPIVTTKMAKEDDDDSASFLMTHPKTWAHRQVIKWLKLVGVSKRAISPLKEWNVDGALLLTLEPSMLDNMELPSDSTEAKFLLKQLDGLKREWSSDDDEVATSQPQPESEPQPDPESEPQPGAVAEPQPEMSATTTPA